MALIHSACADLSIQNDVGTDLHLIHKTDELKINSYLAQRV